MKCSKIESLTESVLQKIVKYFLKQPENSPPYKCGYYGFGRPSDVTSTSKIVDIIRLLFEKELYSDLWICEDNEQNIHGVLLLRVESKIIDLTGKLTKIVSNITWVRDWNDEQNKMYDYVNLMLKSVAEYYVSNKIYWALFAIPEYYLNIFLKNIGPKNFEVYEIMESSQLGIFYWGMLDFRKYLGVPK